jgi:hypothetical protein
MSLEYFLRNCIYSCDCHYVVSTFAYTTWWSVPVTFRRPLKIDKREAENDICLIAAMLDQVWIRSVRWLFPFEASALRRHIYFNPVRSHAWKGRSNASGTLVHLFDELYIGVYRNSEFTYTLPSTSSRIHDLTTERPHSVGPSLFHSFNTHES